MAQLPQDVRRALLRFLMSPSDVRAGVIRRLHDRAEDALVDTLVELEADPSLRREAVRVLELAELDAIQRRAMRRAPQVVRDGRFSRLRRGRPPASRHAEPMLPP